MEKVAPVRAIGIRLMPAVPFDPLATKPQVTEPVPQLPVPAKQPETKQPLRIVPKPKVALTSTNRPPIQSVQIQPQAPIRLSFSSSSSSASLASASTTGAQLPDQTTKETETTEETRGAVRLSVTSQTPAVDPALDLGVDRRGETPAVDSETEGDLGVKMPVKIAISVPPRATSQPTSLPEALPILVAPAPPVFTDEASRPLDIHDPEPMPSFAAPAGSPTEMEPAAMSETKEPEAIPLRLESPRSTPKPSYTAEQLEKALAVELESQSAREILFDVPVDRILVSDEKVCRAMASDGRVYLVGLELGESTIEVKPKDGMESRLLQVKVVGPWQRSHGAMDLNQLIHAIQPLSPNGNLTVQARNDGSLVVRGSVDNKETAKRIMEVIRKLILVPVVDNLDIL